MALIKASSQLHLYYPPKFAAICEYSGDDTHLVPKPGALIFDPLVFERKLPLLTTCMTSCSVRCNIRGIRGLIQADGVDYSVGAWQDFCLQSVTVRSFVLAEYYTTDAPFARYACFGSTFAVALFIRSQWPLQNAPGQAADVVRPGILLVKDIIINRDNRKSGPSLIWCFLPFNVQFWIRFRALHVLDQWPCCSSRRRSHSRSILHCALHSGAFQMLAFAEAVGAADVGY